MRRIFLVAAVVFSGISAALATACPFCSAVSQTFSEEISTMDVAVIAKLVKVPPPSNKAGDEVQIKVDTFDFTRYGLLHGKVLSISSDSIVRDASSDKSNDKPAGATSEPKGQELTYAARISVDRSKMQVEDKIVNLSPGMAVTAEIKTGSRRIIGYLLSPLIKYKQESLRER